MKFSLMNMFKLMLMLFGWYAVYQFGFYNVVWAGYYIGFMVGLSSISFMSWLFNNEQYEQNMNKALKLLDGYPTFLHWMGLAVSVSIAAASELYGLAIAFIVLTIPSMTVLYKLRTT